jgi:hypothetical protein
MIICNPTHCINLPLTCIQGVILVIVALLHDLASHLVQGRHVLQLLLGCCCTSLILALQLHNSIKHPAVGMRYMHLH